MNSQKENGDEGNQECEHEFTNLIKQLILYPSCPEAHYDTGRGYMNHSLVFRSALMPITRQLFTPFISIPIWTVIKGNVGEERSSGAAQAQIFPGAETHFLQEDQNTPHLWLPRPPCAHCCSPTCSGLIPHPVPRHAEKSGFRKHLCYRQLEKAPLLLTFLLFSDFFLLEQII